VQCSSDVALPLVGSKSKSGKLVDCHFAVVEHRLTCSADNGSQYMHGVALVFLNKSSSKRTGCASASVLSSLRPFDIAKLAKVASKASGKNSPGDSLMLRRLSDRSSFLSLSRRFSRSDDLRRRSRLSSRSKSSFFPTSHSRTGRFVVEVYK